MQRPDGGSDVLRAAAAAWFDLARAGEIPPSLSVSRVARVLAEHPSWAPVREAAREITDPHHRPDLYESAAMGAGAQRVLSDRALLIDSGLVAAARAASRGAQIETAAVAEEFLVFCTAVLPVPEEWLLLDGTFPAGIHARVGAFTLQTFTIEQLRALRGPGPLSQARAFEWDLDLLGGAPFLHCPRPDEPPTPALPWPLLHSRPELLYREPLITLALWDSAPLHMDAVFTVEPGRAVRRRAGDVPAIEATDDGESEYLRRETGAYRVTAAQAQAFTAFCARVGDLVTALAGELTAGKKPKQGLRARRLEHAADHLVRASHRTFGRDFVWEEEADETVLHYVVALEALLSDDRPGSDLSRKVVQRAAGLFLADATRLHVAGVVKSAYDRRSAYAHGSPTQPLTAAELDELRRVTHQVLLRWLLIAPADNGFDKAMDETLLSEEKRHSFVEQPLRAFFTDTPPASVPEDVTAPGPTWPRPHATLSPPQDPSRNWDSP